MERDGNGSRFASFFLLKKKNEGEHAEYIIWLHKILFEHGYCKENIPQIQSRTINGKLIYYCRFRTFTFSSFNWIYEGFYANKVKIIPNWIDKYIEPISLALWIMDDGCWIKDRGIKLATNSFTLKEVKYLASILESKFHLKVSIVSAGAINQYCIYIPKSNLSKPFSPKMVLPHMHPYFLYKLNIINKK